MTVGNYSSENGVGVSAGGRPLRVIHFVTGGFSGATQVAVELVRAAVTDPGMEALLVLRRKRQADPARVEALRQEGLAVEVVQGWSHIATVLDLVRVCRRFKPDVLVAHGFSEHLWGRYAGLWAKVPALVHVEHNSRERYSWWRLAQAKWLAQRTAAIIGCSEGVKSACWNWVFLQIAPWRFPTASSWRLLWPLRRRPMQIARRVS